MRRIDCNGNWSVEKEGTGENRAVHLPHDGMIYEKRDSVFSRVLTIGGPNGYGE